ncbi:MAG: ABC transporter ATP-binding protein [Planctomycetaceae bacterium]|jgi:zinc transport system ATP-binding protein|nr:ABC transporter ATP-binding protein [Planctomycetaceae bacterium]
MVIQFMSVAVEFQSVSFSYESTNVVENATFDIKTGDFVSIIGPNGGGKTTLLKLMLGILKPDQGSICLFGCPPRLNCSKVGYTPQFLSVDFSFPLSVLDVVLMGRIRTGFSLSHLWYSQKDRNAARHSLQILQLEELAEIPFRNLSGGQRQRVLIARALCGEPEILLLDEPTNNIDAASEQILFDTLTKLNQSMTIVVVSHDIGFVSQCVKNVICVNRTVAVHSASAMNGRTIHDLYGQHGMKLVLHDHF